MQHLSSWLWRFNPLFLRLLGEISLSLLCSHSSWGSALNLAPPLRVGRPQESVSCPDRRGLKQLLISAVSLTQAGEWEGYGNHNWDMGWAWGGRGQHDVATACGEPCVLHAKLSIDHGPLAVAGCTGSQGGVDSDLCLHTGFLVAATVLVVHAHLWGLRW